MKKNLCMALVCGAAALSSILVIFVIAAAGFWNSLLAFSFILSLLVLYLRISSPKLKPQTKVKPMVSGTGGVNKAKVITKIPQAPAKITA